MGDERTAEERVAYDRGRVDAVLDEHSRHLRAINGSMERFARALEALTMSLNDHQSQRAAAEGEALAVRLALEDAVRKHDASVDMKWSRREQLAVIAGSILAGLGIALGYLHP